MSGNGLLVLIKKNRVSGRKLFLSIQGVVLVVMDLTLSISKVMRLIAICEPTNIGQHEMDALSKVGKAIKE